MGNSKLCSNYKTFKLDPAFIVGQMRAEVSDNSPPSNVERTARKQKKSLSHTRFAPVKIPKGLIGAKYTASVLIDGQASTCLLDTGSQVTTVSQSFYESNLSRFDIHPLNELLEIEAANGQTVPYSGFIEVDISFPKDCFGSEITVSTFALVVPDVQSNALLVGTNTLDLVYEVYSTTNTAPQAIPYGYRVVLKIMQQRNKQKENSSLGLVRLSGREPKIVPAGQSCVLEGTVHVSCQTPDRWIVIEPPSSSSLPGGVMVTNCLINLPDSPSQRLPVVLRNESKHDITIPAKSVIAEIHALQEVISGKQDTTDAASSTGVSVSSEDVELNFNFDDSPLPPKWRERVKRKLTAMPDVFAQHDSDFGRTDKVKHQIKLSDETSFKHRPRPIRPQDLDAVRRHLQELSEAGVIRESESCFSSPIVVVKKKNGDIRLCIDYRKLNLQTIKDAYALPNLEETFSALSGSKWFSVLDLKSGYYQIEVDEADKHKTAFVCPLGFWEFNRMPQGVTNAPSTFQRLMERCMGDINLKEVLVFLDDLIVFSDSIEEHETRLLHVLSRLKEYGLKLSLEKCKFFQESVRYLGHIVSRNGVETDPQKIEALKTWPSPRNLKELRLFLGFAGYYRRFIQDFSKIVKPLNDLTVGYPPLRKGSRLKEDHNQYFQPSEPFGGRWTDSCQEAFKTIIDKLTTAPVLGFANPKLPYVLHTDASTVGLGAALYQEQDGMMRVIAFASRGLSRSESRYPAHKLEFLALKWAVTDKFCDYLYGCSFTVVTDSNPLTYLLTTAKLDATSYRWLSALSTFNFQIQYRAGRRNLDADGLSRRPHPAPVNDQVSQKEEERIHQFLRHHLPESDDVAHVSCNTVSAVCEKHLVCPSMSFDGADSAVPLVASLAMSAEAVPDNFEQCDGFPTISSISEEELKQKQRADPAIGEIIHQLETGDTPPPTLRRELPELSVFLREISKLELQNGILYRKRLISEETHYQLVLPEELREMVLRSLHDDMGHLGIDRTLDLARTRFFWPKMANDIERKIKSCSRCVCRKALPEKAAPLVNIQVTRPLELVCMDFLSIEPDRSNTKDVLVITDFFTKYAVAIPTPNQKARTVAKHLWENFVVHYGFPEKLHSDQGPDFESKTIKELCDLAGIHKVRTTPYHPRGNPVERFNRTLLNMLGTLKTSEKQHWRDFVKPLVHAYNCTKHDTTGFTPYELMFGRQPRLPIDLAFNVPLNRHQHKSHSKYVQTLKNHLQESYQLATKNAAKTAERNKIRFDKHVTESTLDDGDRVLVRNVRLRGKHKLADKWEGTVYVVVNRKADLPVYTVRPENQDGPLRTLHRDLLLPCGFLSLETDPPAVSNKHCTRPSTRLHPDLHPDGREPELVSDDEDENSTPFFQDPSLRTTKFTQELELIMPPRQESHFSVEPNCSDEVIPDNAPEELAGTLPECDTLLETDNMPELDLRPGIDQSDKENLPGLDLETGSDQSEEDNLPGQMSDESLNGTELGPVTAKVGDVPEILAGGNNKRSSESEHVATDVAHRSETNINETTTTRSEVETSAVRRSSRHREQSKRLTYPELGNPMVTIVQSLFQNLGSVITDLLMEPCLTPLPEPEIV